MKIETGTIVRTATLVLALINQILSVSGKPILPIEDAQVELLLSTGITVVVALVSWWKNNSFTQPALESNKLMKDLKAEQKEMSVIVTPHVENIGWMPEVRDGAVAGTTNQSLRLEAVRVKADLDGDINVFCRACVASKGWLEPVFNGDICGTVGEGLPLEALQFQLTGDLSIQYDILYSIHVQNIGWMNWSKNGELIGTEGYDLRAEAIRIMIVPKGIDLSVDTLDSHLKKLPSSPEILNLKIGEKGIDVSEYQGDINFDKVKADGYSFVIVRALDNDYADPLFVQNIQRARKSGLKVGSYQFSRATNNDETVRETSLMLSRLKEVGGVFEAGVWCDRELTDSANKNATSQVIDTWCSILTSAGYICGFYSGYYYTLENVNETIRLKYPHWLAQYNTSCDLPAFIWQKSDTGRVNGINGNVDINEVTGQQYSKKSPENNDGENYFTADEFKCECGCGGDVVQDLKDLANRVRSMYGHPLVVTSGFRCDYQNRLDGGVSNSNHKIGHAVDLYSPGRMNSHEVDMIAECIRACGGGVIMYHSNLFCHMELSNAFWSMN